MPISVNSTSPWTFYPTRDSDHCHITLGNPKWETIIIAPMTRISEQHVDQDKSKPAYSYLVAAVEVEHPSDEGKSNCFIVETVVRFDRHLTSNLIDAGIQNTSEDAEAWMLPHSNGVLPSHWRLRQEIESN
jgi:hypothetical protein